MTAGQKIKTKASKLGFDLVGIARADPVPDFDHFERWLNQGYHATMTYLDRGREKRRDPKKILPGVRSIICCGMNYYVGGEPGPVGRYARGEDYHVVVGERLKQLEEFIQKEIDPGAQTKSHVDTGPILERSYAARAGLGWIGKNTLLVDSGIGSFFVLGEVLTSIEFEESQYDRPVTDQCGACTKCLDACPTRAFVEPRVLDARRCISFLTTAYKGPLSEEQKTMVGDHVRGCDICQEVCPYNFK